MAEANEFPILSYVATLDPEVYARVTKKKWKSNWRFILGTNLQDLAYYALIGGLSATVGSTSVGGQFRWKVLVYGAAFAAVVSAILLVASWDTALRSLVRKGKPQSWKCELSDSAFKFEDEDRIMVSIPWSIMSIELEDPDAWLIIYRGNELVVFRKPLRSSGLEDEFRRRVGKAEPEKAANAESLD